MSCIERRHRRQPFAGTRSLLSSCRLSVLLRLHTGRYDAFSMSAQDLSRITIYFDQRARQHKLMERLEAEARRERRSVSFIIVEAIARYFDVDLSESPREES